MFRTWMSHLAVWILVAATAVFVGRSAPLAGAKPQCVWTDVEKVIAVGDLHGGYENFVKILQNKDIGLIDQNLHWTGGKTHLVQTGDVMDRGKRAKEILDLMRALEPEARKAGGMVHFLLGNHEELALIRLSLEYSGYVTKEQFLDFLPDRERARLENRLKSHANFSANPDAYWQDVMGDENERNLYYDTFNKRYGLWLAEHNVIIRIDDVVFVHGGISLQDSQKPIEEINDLYREEFEKILRGESFQPRIVFRRSDTPLWNRDLAVRPEAEYEGTVDKILANLSARHLVVAHTPTLVREEDQTRFGDKVYIIDTGINTSVYRRGHISALIINNGKIHIWKGDNDEQETVVGRTVGLARFHPGRLGPSFVLVPEATRNP